MRPRDITHMTVRLSLIVASLAALVPSAAAARTERPLAHAETERPGVVRAAWRVPLSQERDDQESSDTVMRTFKVGPRGSLDISNFSGTIVITGVTGDEIRVKAVKQVWGGKDSHGQLEGIVIDASETPGRIEVRTLFGRHKKSKAAVDYTVEVPFDTTITARSMSGDVKVMKVRGDVQLDSTSGNIEAMATPRLVRLKTFSGDIVVTEGGAADVLSASTISGNLMIKSLKARALDLVTVSGDLTLLGTTCERAQLRTVNGSVEFAGRIVKGGRYEFNSHSGDVSVQLAGSQGFELSATTFSGDVNTDIPLVMATRPDERALPPGVPRSQDIRGTFGDGGALLLVKTFSGDVSVGRAGPPKPPGKEKARQ
jgi:DUF4097 and DUF4098 domain-containing protein YvlB